MKLNPDRGMTVGTIRCVVSCTRFMLHRVVPQIMQPWGEGESSALLSEAVGPARTQYHFATICQTRTLANRVPSRLGLQKGKR